MRSSGTPTQLGAATALMLLCLLHADAARAQTEEARPLVGDRLIVTSAQADLTTERVSIRGLNFGDHARVALGLDRVAGIERGAGGDPRGPPPGAPAGNVCARRGPRVA